METSTGFVKEEVVLNVAILPSSSGNPMDAVKKQLNDMLFRYNDSVGGVILTYSDVKFQKGKEYGKIIGEQPHIHIDILTKLLVFQPTLGMVIEGQIIKVVNPKSTPNYFSDQIFRRQRVTFHC